MRFVRWTLIALACLVLLYSYLAWIHPVGSVPDHPFFDEPGPWAIAHQGGRGLWPENTLYAFEQATALGVDVLEMDLRASADGEIVVMHDATVDRTTDGSGPIADMTLDEIRELDAGYGFQNDSREFAFRGRGLVVPTLDEVLSHFPGARVNLEMKEFTPALAKSLCALIEARGASERVLIASFRHEPMATFRRECPRVATSATMREGLLLYQLHRFGLARLYRGAAVALQIPEALGERRVLDRRLLDLADALNVKVQVWTINEEDDMERLLDMGVQGILTDYPDRLLPLLGRRRSAAR